LIFDYAILMTFVLTALLFIIIILLRSSLLKLSDKAASKSLNRFSLHLMIFYFFMAFILLGKLVSLLALPTELKNYAFKFSLFSFPSLFLTNQGLFFSVYVFCIAMMVIHWNLKPDIRYHYLAKVLKFILFFSLLDLLISFIEYFQLNQTLLFYKQAVSRSAFWSWSWPAQPSFLFIIVLLLLCVAAFSWLWQKKQNRFGQYIYLTLFITLWSMEIVLTVFNLKYLHSPTVLHTSVMQMFALPSGIISWLWFFLIVFTPGALFYSFLLCKLDKAFLNIYYARSYVLQLNKIVYLSLVGLGLLALLPNILIYVFN